MEIKDWLYIGSLILTNGIGFIVLVIRQQVLQREHTLRLENQQNKIDSVEKSHQKEIDAIKENQTRMYESIHNTEMNVLEIKTIIKNKLQ